MQSTNLTKDRFGMGTIFLLPHTFIHGSHTQLISLQLVADVPLILKALHRVCETDVVWTNGIKGNCINGLH